MPGSSRCIWCCLSKEKTPIKSQEGYTQQQRHTLLCTKLGFVYDNIPSFILAIFLYFLLISFSSLPETALPNCFTDKLKATKIQKFSKLLTVQVYIFVFWRSFHHFIFHRRNKQSFGLGKCFSYSEIKHIHGAKHLIKCFSECTF